MQRSWFALVLVIAVLLVGAAESLAAEVSVVDGKLSVTGQDEIDDLIDIRPTPFSYEVYDGSDELVAGPGCGGASPHLVYCQLKVSAIAVDGGPGNDLIGLWDIEIPAELTGAEGNDFLEGGHAPDTVTGGIGDDTIIGGEGDDSLAAEEGSDFVRGGKDADTIKGGGGDDVLDGESGDGNVVVGGDGRDLIRGGPEDDRLVGDAGDDALLGGGGKDVFETGPGQDEVFGVELRDDLRCSDQDAFRGDQRGPAQCPQLGAEIARPTVWPPQDAADAARIPPADPKVSAHVRRPGSASRTSVCIRHPYFVADVLVTVRTYSRGGRLVNSFKRVMDASTCATFRHPGPGRTAVYARARRGGSF
jgi:Ca2+-binding RTX toxin-like protein